MSFYVSLAVTLKIIYTTIIHGSKSSIVLFQMSISEYHIELDLILSRFKTNATHFKIFIRKQILKGRIATNGLQRLYKSSKKFASASLHINYKLHKLHTLIKSFYHNANLDLMKHKWLHKTSAYKTRSL